MAGESNKQFAAVNQVARVKMLKELIMDDETLSKLRTDDSYLLRFLYCTDFNVDMAFIRMKNYCQLFLEHPDWFARKSPLEMQDEINRISKAMINERDRCGRPIYIIKLGKFDASQSSPPQESQLDEIWFEMVMDDPQTQSVGVSVIIDTSGYSWKLFRWLTPGIIRISISRGELYPAKQIMYHVVNTSFVANATIKLGWPLLPRNIKDTIKFHYNNWSSLHEYMDPKILPSEYGGTGPDLDFHEMNQLLFAQNEEIARRVKYQRDFKLAI